MKMLAAGCVLGILVCVGCDRAANEPAPAQTPQAQSPAASSRITVSYAGDARIVFEAESGAIKAPMVVFESGECSRGKYVLAPEGPEHKEISLGGDVTHAFEVKDPGEYTLWLRVNFNGACGNSLGILLDGAELGAVEDAVFEKWHWTPLRGQRLNLASGAHTLGVVNREDGTAYDQVLLTRDADLRPMGIETPTESVPNAGGSAP